MNLHHFSTSSHEARELRYESHVWDNAKNLVQGTFKDHVITPAKNGNALQASVGGVIAVGDTILNMTDAVIAGVTGERLERLKSNQWRVGRTVGNIGHHTVSAAEKLLTLHPLEAAGHAAGAVVGGVVGVVRAPGEIFMDGLDEFGYRKLRPAS